MVLALGVIKIEPWSWSSC